MSRAWMPLYVGDFTADTMHLGATETGIYIRLIMHCWQHGTIPRDDRTLAIISHCDTRLWHQYRSKILPFFDVVDASTMQHKRVSAELQRCEEISNKRKDAAKQKHSNSSASALQLHTQSQSPSPSKKEKKERAAKAAPYSEEFEKGFWFPYPTSQTMSKKEAWQAWQRLPIEKREAACKAIEPYKRLMASKPQFIKHACRFLSQEIFESFISNGTTIAPVIDIRAHLA